MQFMIIVKATPESEGGAMPSRQMLEAMGKYNEELVKAGVLLAAEGLQPSATGARVTFGAGTRTVVDGPFSETKELIAGFWLWQVKSKDEAIAWVQRAPMPEGAVIEIRRVHEAADFGDALTPELLASEQRMRDQVAARR